MRDPFEYPMLRRQGERAAGDKEIVKGMAKYKKFLRKWSSSKKPIHTCGKFFLGG